jgi:chemotaxis protein CheC
MFNWCMFEKLNSREIDILREVSNIGAGHAATALSQLIGRRINLEVPEVVLEDISKVAEIAGGADALVAGLYFQILGDSRGNIFMIFPAASARAIVALATGQEMLSDFQDEMSVSTIKEVGNILSSAFLSAISQLTGLSLIPSVPGFAYDMAGSILDYVLIEISRLADKALVIETAFTEGREEIKGHFFLLPDPHTLDVMLRALEGTGRGE